MDASASSKVNANINDVYALFFKLENMNSPLPHKRKNTVIKYTKLPDFDFEAKGMWSQQNYTLQPRLRRIVSLEEPEIRTSRSLKTANPPTYTKSSAPNVTNKRKIVTISEDDENDLHPKFSKDFKKPSSTITNTSCGVSENEVKQTSNRAQVPNSARCSKIAPNKFGAKIDKVPDAKDTKEPFRASVKSRTNVKQIFSNDMKSKNANETDPVKKPKSVAFSRSSSIVSKNIMSSSNSHQPALSKSKLNENNKWQTSKKYPEKPQKNKLPIRNKASFILETPKNNKTLPVIHVPLEAISPTKVPVSIINSANPTILLYPKSDGTMDTNLILHKNIDTETEALPKTENKLTDMEGFEPEILIKCFEADVQTDLIQEKFDKLDIPDVSLITDKAEREQKEKLLNLQTQSLPNLRIPELNITDNRSQLSFLDARLCKNSYFISSATLTYRTQQEINLQVVETKDHAFTNQLPSPLTYPMSVVSVFKEEMSSRESNNISMVETHDKTSDKNYKNCINAVKSLDCSYAPYSNKLMKPSDIISTIGLNNSLLQSMYSCEQFQRELCFIDSFFESLQYLENCSLSEKCLKNNEINDLVKSPALQIGAKNSEYDTFLSKLENGGSSDDAETMASKNLYLLNVLIRDEQRRAKNFLCVLKKREDALKDFTKSQILYLENKKKQDNTDISALKKKQRGALLKLQHECGEMQRMRKALLTLSEKRKVALMKTKKDLELKLKNHVDVELSIIGKKKLKRSQSVDRPPVPIKCFDLSSSSCEDSSTSKVTSESSAHAEAPVLVTEEKCIQTCDTIPETQTASSTDENLVVVDGGYLNILFHNLTLPQIFSSGKQYEVNAEALKHIVDSTNSNYLEDWGEVVEKLMDQKLSRLEASEPEKCSTPSTARSLVDELERDYYRTLAEENRTPDGKERSNAKVLNTSEIGVQITMQSEINSEMMQSVSTSTEDNIDKCLESVVQSLCECELSYSEEMIEPLSPAGPLPVPAGEANVSDTSPSLSKLSEENIETSSSSNQSVGTPCLSASSLAEPTSAEAEELRRQQLAIEKEIKELEQQQCRLLVVREIPDKPPPPYTPPTDCRPPKQPRAFKSSDVNDQQIRRYVTEPSAKPDFTDPFDTIVHDFCKETVKKHKVEQSDKPWDSYNLLPQKLPLITAELIDNVTKELKDVLTPAPASGAPAVGSRRSDHIDDILFSEWRRVEPEWTSLHTDEAVVKNQVFEIIFQRILTDTVDEYKRTILSPVPD